MDQVGLSAAPPYPSYKMKKPVGVGQQVPYPPYPVDTSTMLAPITDPNMVRQFQTMLANALAGGGGSIGTDTGLTSADYGSADVDGNPSNPRWTRVLGIVQSFINQQPRPPIGKLPVGFPTQLRTDGVLDNATGIILINA